MNLVTYNEVNHENWRTNGTETIETKVALGHRVTVEKVIEPWNLALRVISLLGWILLVVPTLLFENARADVRELGWRAVRPRKEVYKLPPAYEFDQMVAMRKSMLGRLRLFAQLGSENGFDLTTDKVLKVTDEGIFLSGNTISPVSDDYKIFEQSIAKGVYQPIMEQLARLVEEGHCAFDKTNDSVVIKYVSEPRLSGLGGLGEISISLHHQGGKFEMKLDGFPGEISPKFSVDYHSTPLFEALAKKEGAPEWITNTDKKEREQFALDRLMNGHFLDVHKGVERLNQLDGLLPGDAMKIEIEESTSVFYIDLDGKIYRDEQLKSSIGVIPKTFLLKKDDPTSIRMFAMQALKRMRRQEYEMIPIGSGIGNRFLSAKDDTGRVWIFTQESDRKIAFTRFIGTHYLNIKHQEDPTHSFLSKCDFLDDSLFDYTIYRDLQTQVRFTDLALIEKLAKAVIEQAENWKGFTFSAPNDIYKISATIGGESYTVEFKNGQEEEPIIEVIRCGSALSRVLNIGYEYSYPMDQIDEQPVYGIGRQLFIAGMLAKAKRPDGSVLKADDANERLEHYLFGEGREIGLMHDYIAYHPKLRDQIVDDFMEKKVVSEFSFLGKNVKLMAEGAALKLFLKDLPDEKQFQIENFCANPTSLPSDSTDSSGYDFRWDGVNMALTLIDRSVGFKKKLIFENLADESLQVSKFVVVGRDGKEHEQPTLGLYNPRSLIEKLEDPGGELTHLLDKLALREESSIATV